MNGRKLARDIEASLKVEVLAISDQGIIPTLGTVQVGDDEASNVYIRMKRNACKRVGIRMEEVKLEADIAMEALLAAIAEMNADPDVHGILVQMPLPAGLNAMAVLETIDPSKDVDGLTSVNLGRLARGDPGQRPCTPKGIITLLDHYDVHLKGANAAIINHSVVVGRPLALLMAARDATVSVLNEFTDDIAPFTSKADIVVVAAGVPGLVRGDMIKDGAVVVDVGMNRVDGALVGDADHDSVVEKARLLTPVPGGVGPMTVSSLISNTVEAARGRL